MSWRLAALAAALLAFVVAGGAQAQQVSLGGAVPLSGSTCTNCTLSGATTLGAALALPGGGLITTTGEALLGYGTPITMGGATNHLVQAASTAGRIAVARYSANTIGAAAFFGKSRGASVGTAGAVASGDALLDLRAQGDDGSTANAITIRAASLLAEVDGTVSTGIVPGRWVWRTMNTAGVEAERMRLGSAGDLGIGITPTSQLHLGGTYTTSSAALVNVASTLVSSVTSAQNAISIAPTFNPSGASISTIYGVLFNPKLTGSLNLGNNLGFSSRLETLAGYSGTITIGAAYHAWTPTIGGTNPIATYLGFAHDAITNGNGLTSGTVHNRGVNIAAITAGAAGGTINNRAIQISVPSGGASSGTADNRGLFITGNGGTASGGTVANHAIYSDSTAKSLFAGGMQLGTTTALTVAAGELGYAKITASGTAPGADGAKEAWVCGTNAGTAKKIAYAGTSTTPTTIIDNVGSGVTGC